MNSPSHILHGGWRLPSARQTEFNSLDLWVELAQTLEKGLFDMMFLADVSGLYDDYQGSYRKHVEAGMQIPSNDPSVILSALAYTTEHLGFAFTSNVLQEHPFNFARKISTLDHASGGRICWNIVTNALAGAAHNFGQELTPHDERYQWANEYVDVVYKLWEGSWDEGAVHQDRAGVYADFDKIHRINHVGERYQVAGPHLAEPSPQRTPLLFQAGSSGAGREFAAAHAEAQLLVVPRPEMATAVIDDMRSRLQQNGRDTDDLLFIQGLSFVIGSTEEEVARKEHEFDEAIDIEAMVAHSGGAVGANVGTLPLDTPLSELKSEGSRSYLEWIRASVQDREATIRDMGIIMSKSTRVAGTPEQIATQLEVWRDAGIDGINVINMTIPGSYVEFIEQVMPELRQRGLAKEAYSRGSLRQKLFGRDRLPDTHPAAAYRNAFR